MLHFSNEPCFFVLVTAINYRPGFKEKTGLIVQTRQAMFLFPTQRLNSEASAKDIVEQLEAALEEFRSLEGVFVITEQ